MVQIDPSWRQDFTGATTLPTLFNSTTNFPTPAGSNRHHITSRDLITASANSDIPPLNANVRDIAVELGTFIDPDTQRAIFDIGSRADNAISLPTSSLPGQVAHDSNHRQARIFAQEVATRAAEQYVLARTGRVDHLTALRAAGRYWTGMNNAQKMLLVGAYTPGELNVSGSVNLSNSGGPSVFDNPAALANALEGTAAFEVGNNSGRVLDFSGLYYGGQYKALLDPNLRDALLSGQADALLQQLKTEVTNAAAGGSGFNATPRAQAHRISKHHNTLARRVPSTRQST